MYDLLLKGGRVIDPVQGLDATLERVGREIRLSCPPLSQELAMTGYELRAGASRAQALRHLAERSGQQAQQLLAQEKTPRVLRDWNDLSTAVLNQTIAEISKGRAAFMAEQTRQVAFETDDKGGRTQRDTVETGDQVGPWPRHQDQRHLQRLP